MERHMLIITFVNILICYCISEAYELKKANWNWFEGTRKVVYIWINPNCEPDPSAQPPTTQRQAIQNAMSTWCDVETNFVFEYATSSNVEDYTENGQNDFFWYDGQHPEDPSILAETWPWNPYPPDITEIDCAFFDNHVWSTSSTPGEGQYDVESIALHELGHVLGLWDVAPPSSAVMCKVIDAQELKRNLTTDDMNGMKAIYGLVMDEPNGSEIWYIDTSYDITWDYDGVDENVDILLNRFYPSDTWIPIISDILNEGTYDWTPTEPPRPSTCRIRVRSNDNNFVYDDSDANFTIGGYQVTQPSAPGITWLTGEYEYITWLTAGNTGLVNIRINRNYPTGEWDDVALGASDNRSFH